MSNFLTSGSIAFALFYRGESLLFLVIDLLLCLLHYFLFAQVSNPRSVLFFGKIMILAAPFPNFLFRLNRTTCLLLSLTKTCRKMFTKKRHFCRSIRSPLVIGVSGTAVPKSVSQQGCPRSVPSFDRTFGARKPAQMRRLDLDDQSIQLFMTYRDSQVAIQS